MRRSAPPSTAGRRPPADDNVHDATTGGAVVEFGDSDGDKPLGGRRAKAERERKKKLKAGAFGECVAKGEGEEGKLVCSTWRGGASGGGHTGGREAAALARSVGPPAKTLLPPQPSPLTHNHPTPPHTYSETMGLSPTVLRGVRRKGFRLPTPIQRRALPPALAGADVVAMARTGSGKTAAFALPIIQRLGAHSPRAGARALVLAPSRELALQTRKHIADLARYTDLRIAALVGGDALDAQFAELASNPDVLVATPGRLLHLLSEVSGLSLASVTIAVLDEADRLFELGLAPQVKALLAGLPATRQALLFSATLPSALADFAAAKLTDPIFVRLDADAALSPDLGTVFVAVRPEERDAALVWLVREAVPADAPVAVFCATRHAVEYVARLLARDLGPTAIAAVHGSLDQAARTIAVARLRAQRARVLVVTDVAARGLDVPHLDAVINYDFPPIPKLFVHRAGRVARAGRPGVALSLADRGELAYLFDLHLFLGRRVAPVPPRGEGPTPATDTATLPTALAVTDPDPLVTRLGTVPQAALDADGERVRAALDSDIDLAHAKRGADNAAQMYKRTRPPASPESVARARSVPPVLGAHPGLAACAGAAAPAAPRAGAAAAAAAEAAAALRAWRPSATVLEADVAPGRRPDELPNAMASARGGASVAARAFRAAHGAAVAGARADAAAEVTADAKRRAEAAARDGDGGEIGGDGRFRDDAFYIPSARAPTNDAGYALAGATGMAAAVMDLVDDDGARPTPPTGKRRYHWDAKQKRYVGLQAGERVAAGKRTREAGAHLLPSTDKANAGAAYARWSAATRLAVAPTGGAEGADAGRLAAARLSDRFARGGRGWVNPASSKRRKLEAGPGGRRGPRDEVKSEDQMRAAARKAERERERTAGRGKGRGRPAPAAPATPKRLPKGAPRSFGKGGARAFGETAAVGGGGRGSRGGGAARSGRGGGHGGGRGRGRR